MWYKVEYTTKEYEPASVEMEGCSMKGVRKEFHLRYPDCDIERIIPIED